MAVRYVNTQNIIHWGRECIATTKKIYFTVAVSNAYFLYALGFNMLTF